MTNLTIEELIKTVKAFNNKEEYQQVIDFMPLNKVETYQNDELNHEFATAFAAKATELENEGDYKVAINYITRSIKLFPKNSEYHFHRACIYHSKEDYDDAIKGFNKAIEYNPQAAKYFYHKGLTYRKQKKYSEAVADYDQAIALQPDYAEAYTERGNLWYSTKKYDKCIPDFTNAIRIDPNQFEAWFYRGCAWLLKKEYDKGIADLTQAIVLDPNDASAYLNRGHCYEAKKEYDKAIEDYNKADDEAFNWIIPVFFRARVWIEKQEYRKALEDLNKVIDEMNRKFPGAHCKRGIVWFELKKYYEAFIDLKRALELNPEDKEAREWLDKTEAILKKSPDINNYRQSVREQAASFIEKLVKDFQKRFKSHDDGFMYGNYMGKWDAVKNCPTWAGITGWLPAFRPDIAKWGRYSYLREEGKGEMHTLTHTGELFNTGKAGLPIRNELWAAITNNEDLYLYDEDHMSAYRKFEKVAPMLNRIAARIRNGNLDNDLIFEGPPTPHTKIVRKIEKLLGRKMTFVYEAVAPRELEPDEPGCIVDKDGFVFELYLCNAGIQKLDKIIPLIKKLDLIELNLSHNSISDITLLGQLTELSDLDISYNQISDITPVSKITNLEYLFADNNPIVDIKPLTGMHELEILHLDNAGISDISALKGMTKLESLSLMNNKVSDISILKSFKKLTHIFLTANLISDISALEKLKHLENVRLDNNKISVLPSWILDWGLDIIWNEYTKGNYVRVKDNPFNNPPVAIIKEGNKALKDWFAKTGT